MSSLFLVTALRMPNRIPAVLHYFFRFCGGFAPVQNQFSAFDVLSRSYYYYTLSRNLKKMIGLWCQRGEVSKPIPYLLNSSRAPGQYRCTPALVYRPTDQEEKRKAE